ncbi:MAG: hypothetical protein GKS06_17405 [Acidobacteria bacterium]|nr:hypothetical protein [Acidobacteriota bacterium]
MEYAAVALVVIAALIPIVAPLVWPPLLRLREAAGPAADLARLEERKASLYGAIKEVGFDLRMDKMSDEDYEHEVSALKREAVIVVGEIEALRKNPPRGPEHVENAIAASREESKTPAARTAVTASSFCIQCGGGLGEADRFCAHCGNQIVSES